MDLAQQLLKDAFTRIPDDLPGHLGDVTPNELLWQPDPDANSMAWLAWHLARVQDDHMAAVGGVEQVWTSQGWAERFGLPYSVDGIGFGQSADEVAKFDVTDVDLLVGYQRAAHALSLDVLASLDDDDFATVIDRRWDPPVTVGVRVVSVINDITQHIGQIGYLRGLVQRRRDA